MVVENIKHPNMLISRLLKEKYGPWMGFWPEKHKNPTNISGF